jgi:hypothetical protein
VALPGGGTAGAVAAELAGDRDGIVVRFQGDRLERLARAVPPEGSAPGPDRRAFPERSAHRVDGDASLSLDEEFGDAVADLDLPAVATLLVAKRGAAVLLLDDGARSGLVTKLTNAALKKEWPELIGRT